jgi:phospholipase/carboxylesterase
LRTRRELLLLSLVAPFGVPHSRIGIGKKRDGAVYVPASAPAKGAPLVVYLHGAGGSGARAIERLIEHADRLGMIVIAPDSRGRTWGFSGSGATADLVFIDQAIDRIMTAHKVDERRVGIAGFSDGASMALSWGLINGKLFSAIAAFSPGFINLAKDPIGKPRIFISHGRQDQILPIERCGRRLASELRKAGYSVDYREFDGDHTIPPEIRRAGLDSL